MPISESSWERRCLMFHLGNAGLYGIEYGNTREAIPRLPADMTVIMVNIKIVRKTCAALRLSCR